MMFWLAVLAVTFSVLGLVTGLVSVILNAIARRVNWLGVAACAICAASLPINAVYVLRYWP